MQLLIFAYIWWGRAVDEEEICVVDSVIDEFLFIVLGFIEADDGGNPKVFEYLEVIFW